MNDEKRMNLLPIFHVINAMILVASAGYFFFSWGELPEKIAVHFNIDKMPDRWADKGFEMILIFAMPWILSAILYAVGFVLIPWMVKNHPEMVNVPNKEKLLSLPLEKQNVVWNITGELIAVICIVVNALFLYLIYGTIQFAFGKADRLHSFWMFPLMALLVIVIVIYTIRIFRVSKKLTDG